MGGTHPVTGTQTCTGAPVGSVEEQSFGCHAEEKAKDLECLH